MTNPVCQNWEIDLAADGSKRREKTTARISKSTVDAMARPASGTRGMLWDTEVKGFGVRITANGVRTYVLRYRMGGADTPQRMLTIGRHGSPWTAELARKRAVELLAQVRLGTDHVAERDAAKAAAVADLDARADRMFAAFADAWMKDHVQRDALRSETDINGVVERDLKPAFVGKTIDEISKADVTAMLNAIGARSEAAANKAHKWLRAIYNWMIEKGHIDRSPLDRMSPPFKEGERTRVLRLGELVVLWVALEAVVEPFRTFHRLLILLGQRLRETAGVPWDELDLDADDWLLPRKRTKNANDHLVPLSIQAIELLEGMQPDKKLRRGHVFTTNGLVGISGFSKAKIAIDDAVAKLIASDERARALVPDGFEPWVIHDIRRSLATGCQAMGVAIEHTEAILNHVSGKRTGVVGIYHLHDYYDEKAEALDEWGELIAAALTCWEAGNIDGIRALDPARRRRRRRKQKLEID
ncbi:integrase family protein [Sphingomonas sp.]|jgi:integrase|uniref:tyrosine-type recombinase/integrase n=1 Tax=Sphingomonas sp. TaxID=28214 RepID=UPI002E2FE14D|nr:integrase family protein [Sphingomonas sp.]HEX4694443.1 integrase family protein [Sphingomonas sp.]